MKDLWPNQSPASNRRWRWPFRCRGSRHESAVAGHIPLGGLSIYGKIHPRFFASRDLFHGFWP